MADQPARRSRRPDSKQMWDESDRRNPPRDRDFDRDRRDDRPRRRDDRDDRSRRYRSRSRDRRDRYRSRSRDRDRERDHDRRREHNRDHARDRRDRERPRERDGVNAQGARGGRNDRPRGGGQARRGDDSRKEHDHASNTYRRSASPKNSGDDAETQNSPLPSRPKHERTVSGGRQGTPHAAPVSFKVGGANENRGLRGKSTEQERKTPDSGRFGSEQQGEPMEEDDEDEIEVEDSDMAAMQAMMGFGGFDSTKGKRVAGNASGAVRKEKKTEYRQYMNRIGGFNRPLSPSR